MSVNIILALYLPIFVAQEHDIIGLSEAGQMGVGSNLEPWVTLQGLTKNPVDNVIKEGRGHCWTDILALTFDLVDT